MLKNLTLEGCAQYLLSQDGFLLLTHKKTDGDTLGSAAALCMGLRQKGKQAYLLYNEDVTPRFSYLVEALWAPEGFVPSCIVTVDVADTELLPANALHFAGKCHLAIDHHPSNSLFAPRILLDATAGACGEIIFSLLSVMECAVTQEIAEAVYTAVSTDTGCFLFSNTTAQTHMVAARCIEGGADYSGINYRCFRKKTKARLAIEAHLFREMQFFFGGRMAISVLERELIDSLGADDDDLDNLSNLAMQLETVICGVLLTQTPDCTGWRISARSKAPIDVSLICRTLGGGGHARAAGGTIKNALRDEAVRAVLLAAEETVNA